MAKPKLSALWAAFPTHAAYRTLGDLYRALGGAAERNITAPGFGEEGNGCASRMSVALNKSGAPISASSARAAGARTVGTGDGSRIIYAVRDLRAYLGHTFGRPTADKLSPFDDAFRGKKGIIAFSVTGWTGASGHIALFDGRTYREPDHDDYAAFADGAAHATRGEFWEMV